MGTQQSQEYFLDVVYETYIVGPHVKAIHPCLL